MVKNSPADAGGMGSIPSPESSHIRQSNYACAPQLLSLCSRAQKPQPLNPHTAATEAHIPGAYAPQQGKPPQWETHASQLEGSPCSVQLEKSPRSSKDPAQSKIN